MVISKLSAGMTVYEVRKASGLQRFNGEYKWWPIFVKQIDTEKKRVFASWNYNTPRWYLENEWKKWRMNKPKED